MFTTASEIFLKALSKGFRNSENELEIDLPGEPFHYSLIKD